MGGARKILGSQPKQRQYDILRKRNLSQNFILMLFILCHIFSIFKSQRGCQKPVLQVEPGAGDRAGNQPPHLHGAGWEMVFSRCKTFQGFQICSILGNETRLM